MKFVLGLASFAAFVWWGLTVPLGERTLFGHMTAIVQSRESQELVRGTKQKVGEVSRRLGAEGKDRTDDPQAVAEGDGVGQGEATKGPAGPEKPRVAGKTPPPAEPKGAEKTAAAPQEKLTDSDRKQMRRLLGDETKSKAGLGNNGDRTDPTPTRTAQAPAQRPKPLK